MPWTRRTSALRVMNTLLGNTTFRTDRMADSLRGDFSTATDLADYLVRQGLPFRQAHEVVGKIVGDCVRSGRVLEDLTAEDLIAASPLFRRGGPGRAGQPARQRRRPRGVRRDRARGGAGAVGPRERAAGPCLA